MTSRRRAGRRNDCRRRANCVCPGQSPGHSAHIGEEVEVHYRWHPLFGRSVRRHYSEQRVSGRFVHVEAMPGVVTAIAAWMLDPVACTGMAIGAPRVAVSALVDLHHLLIERGFRRSSRDDPNIVHGEQHEEPAHTGAAVCGSAPTQHGARFGEASRDEPIRTRGGARPAGRPLVGSRRRRSEGARR